ncbi:MAG: HAD-IIB family hydrolase [Treponema sp.]|jgi:Cof subfamily protein (haloacid dehalogenase superfamily)|nr:HAD-IIB family hydrolase [Treponema sp.]
MIKALFLDLDGTLLNNKKEITDITKTTLKECKKKGIKLFIVTARPPLHEKMLSWNENLISLFDGGSYYNGGCIIIDNHKKYITISGDIVQGVIKLACQDEKLNIALQLEHEKHAFRFPLDEKGYNIWGVPADEALELDKTNNLQIVKILAFHSNLADSVTPINGEIVKNIESFCTGRAQYYLSDKGKAIQIMAESVSKLNSIEEMRNYYKMEKNEIAVFGDDVPDMEMLCEYEYGFAMGNAESHIKEKARFITLDNNNDGVHHAICNILKLCNRG